MTTPKLPIVLFNTFKNKWAGNRIDFDGVYQYQCVDLIREYAKENGYPAITSYGHAIQLWNQGLGKGYTRVKNTLFGNPPIGAIVFYDYGEYGHVGISGHSNLLWIELLDQNGGSGLGSGLGNDAITLRRKTYSKILGWYIIAQ